MENTTNETIRSLAVLALPRRIDDFIAYAVDVVRAMTVNPPFPIDLPSTLQARTTLSGQSPGALLRFRYRAVTRTGETAWSAPVLGSAR